MKKLLAGLMVVGFLLIGVQQSHASILRDGCSNGEVYSSTTGQKCPTDYGCSNGEVYSSTTGQQCPTSNRSVTVLSPNGGETYEAGDKVTIRWKTMNAYNPNTQVSVMDDRIPDWQTLSLFGSAPALDYAKYVSASGNGANTEYTYEYTFTVPSTFNDSLPSQYQNIYGGKHYKILVNIVVPGQVGIASKQILEDLSNNTFTINPPDQKVSVNLRVNGSDNPSAVTLGSTVKVSWSAKSNGQSIVCYPFGHNIGGWTEYGALPATGSKNLEARIYNYIDNLASFKVGINCNGVEDFVQLPITTSATPSITVLSPNGGEIYKEGDKITVKWKTENFPKNAKIAVYLEDLSGETSALYGSYAELSTNDGEEILSLPSPSYLNFGKYYKINLKYTFDRHIEYDGDSSDNTFAINTPSASLISQCLRDKGVVLYTASWCSHCQDQEKLFGGYFGNINQVECSNSAGGEQSAVCNKENITGYPTWKFKDGSILNGTQSLSALSEKAECNFSTKIDNGCLNGEIYSSMTGQMCNGYVDTGCLPGYRYSSATGRSCAITTPYIETNTSSINRTLKLTNPRMIGEDVKVLQRFLGVYTDGVYGYGTMAKVKEWQRNNGLYPDGAFGYQSRVKAGL